MNKGLIGAAKLTLIFVVLLVSAFFVINFIKPTSADATSNLSCVPPTGTISGYKWNDSNGNGVKDSGENLLSGWNITIKGPVSSSKLTNSSGYYSFTGLTSGTYTIAETLQNGWYNTTNASYKVDIICGSPCSNVNNVNFGNKEQSLCKNNEKLTDFLYESKPTYAYVDNSTSNVSYKLCNSTSVSVDTSDGKTHYVYMDWNPNDINISSYDDAAYFDLMLYHYEDSTLIEVQLKNQTGSWIDVCDPSEHGSFTWDTCDLRPYLNILKNVPLIELRLIVWKSGACREYLGCAELKVSLYKCQPLEYCGDGKVTGSEKCELPNTNDNTYCSQSTTECLGNKLGQRDAFGNCGASCGCAYDSFQYSCVKNQCGAECGQSSDCQNNKCVGNVRYYSGNCDSTSTCSCSYSTEDCSKNGCYAYDTGCEDRSYFCTPGICNYTFSNRNTDYYGNFTSYCSGDSIVANRTLHDFSCEGTCKDHTKFVNNSLVQNCNDLDGWYNTTNTQWNSTGQCTEKEQLQQEYRDYTCSVASCTYTVTNHQWIDTGKTRGKTDGTACDDGLYCTVSDQCTAGVCRGSPRDCSSYNISTIATCDNNPDNYHFTWDFRNTFTSQCNEAGKSCTTGNLTITHTCSVSSCGAECDATHSCNNKCIGNVRYYSGSCNSSCNCSYTTENCDLQDGCYAYGNGCENRDYSCALGGCNYTFSNRSTDYYDSSVNYCLADTIRTHKQSHDFGCNSTCKDHTSFVNDSLVQDCALQNGWNDTGQTRWINDTQCTERQQKEQKYRNYTCSPTPTVNCTYTNTSTQWVNTTTTRPKPVETSCDDGFYCTVDDHCDGQGICTGGSSRNCSASNLVEIATCDNNPDSNPFTFDYAAGFTSTCDEVHKTCSSSSYNYTHICADANSTDNGPAIPVGNGIRTCTAECDGFGTECQNKCIGDVRYFSGNCDLTSCGCSYSSTENCTSHNGCYPYNTGCEDRDYGCTPSNCTYTSSNQHNDSYDNFVNYCYADAIRTNRTLHDFGCDGTCKDHASQIDDELVQDCSIQNGWYNTTNTQWLNVSRCTEKEQFQQEYRKYTCNSNPTVNCSYTATGNQWIDTGNTRNKSVIEPLNPPNKTIGDSKSECQQGEWCEWKITTLTPITLTCENSSVKWRYALDGDWKDWNINGSSVTIYFPEESNHTLEAYCIDDCGNSTADIEKFKVEGTAFEIPLQKKWNLISVPFVLFNDSPSEVFKNISDKIISVWSYDNGNWSTWVPGVGGTLTSIKPGYGYWVIANNDTKLLIGGNLFSPIATPPSKSLQIGWNLIGYYGTDWQTYQIESDNCGYDSYKYGNYVYCSLNSLIDTQQGLPRWSSVWGYDNCGNDNATWHQLESCVGNYWSVNKMIAGKGYWIEMDVSDGYAPATNCMWNKEFKCSVPTI